MIPITIEAHIVLATILSENMGVPLHIIPKLRRFFVPTYNLKVSCGDIEQALVDNPSVFDTPTGYGCHMIVRGPKYQPDLWDLAPCNICEVLEELIGGKIWL